MSRLLRLVLAAGLLTGPAFAQSTVTTQRTTETGAPAVETRTYEKDGKTVTETTTTTVVRDAAAAKKTYKAALFVANRAGADYDDKLPVIEDLLSSRIADLGFEVVSREVAVDALRSFDQATASAARPADSVDAALTEQSSALRLAQNLGVDYIVHATLTSYGKTERDVKAYGQSLKNVEWTLRLSYKILDAAAGGALTGDVAKATRTEQGTANAAVTTTALLDDLLDDATRQAAGSLQRRVEQGRIAAARPKADLVTITLNVEAADVMIPDVRIGAENTVAISESKYKVSPLNATVEVDGVAVGTAPGQISLRPGFSKLRVTREGFKPFERTINAVNGQTLTIALTMSEDGFARWQEATAFINGLKNGAKLTDAQVKVLEGIGEMYKNSFFRVDTKENFKFIVPGTYSEK